MLARRNSEKTKLQKRDALRRNSVSAISAAATATICTSKARHWAIRRPPSSKYIPAQTQLQKSWRRLPQISKQQKNKAAKHWKRNPLNADRQAVKINKAAASPINESLMLQKWLAQKYHGRNHPKTRKLNNKIVQAANLHGHATQKNQTVSVSKHKKSMRRKAKSAKRGRREEWSHSSKFYKQKESRTKERSRKLCK